MSTKSYFDNRFKIDLEKTKQFIKTNSDILITRADKGNCTVIINKASYFEKLENLFNDTKYYDKIKSNPLPKLERETNELIKWLNKIDFSMTGKKFEPVVNKFNKRPAELFRITL